jgi:hypothetical protein
LQNFLTYKVKTSRFQKNVSSLDFSAAQDNYNYSLTGKKQTWLLRNELAPGYGVKHAGPLIELVEGVELENICRVGQ